MKMILAVIVILVWIHPPLTVTLVSNGLNHFKALRKPSCVWLNLLVFMRLRTEPSVFVTWESRTTLIVDLRSIVR